MVYRNRKNLIFFILIFFSLGGGPLKISLIPLLVKKNRSDYRVHGTKSRDIGQNVSNFAGLVWKADFGQFFGNILGLGAYFSKPIFALKR